jgi:hypothetical protein
MSECKTCKYWEMDEDYNRGATDSRRGKCHWKYSNDPDPNCQMMDQGMFCVRYKYGSFQG